MPALAVGPQLQCVKEGILKRIVMFNTAALLLLSLHVCLLAVGQAKPAGTEPKAADTQAQSKRTEPRSTAKEKQVGWDNKTPGVKVFRLWENENLGPADPQIAILRLSDAQYQEFRKDRKKFLIINDIFRTKDLKSVIAASELVPAVKEYKDPPGDDMWLVMVEHDWTCDSASAAVQLFPPKP